MSVDLPQFVQSSEHIGEFLGHTHSQECSLVIVDDTNIPDNCPFFSTDIFFCSCGEFLHMTICHEKNSPHCVCVLSCRKQLFGCFSRCEHAYDCEHGEHDWDNEDVETGV